MVTKICESDYILHTYYDAKFNYNPISEFCPPPQRTQGKLLNICSPGYFLGSDNWINHGRCADSMFVTTQLRVISKVVSSRPHKVSLSTTVDVRRYLEQYW